MCESAAYRDQLHIHPWSTTRDRTRARTRAEARHPGRQLQGPEMEDQPPILSSHPSLPAQYISEYVYNNSRCGGGALWDFCVFPVCTLTVQTLSKVCKILSVNCLPAVLHPVLQAFSLLAIRVPYLSLL